MYNEFAIEGWGFLMIDAPNALNLVFRVSGLWPMNKFFSAHTGVMLC